ncbi:MAG: GtrA family protein, partial [Chitinophagales bacterium]
LFHLLTEHFAWNPVYANIVSAFLGMVINFILQKQFIFILRRKLRTAFLISFVTSIIGISISTAIVYAFTKNNILFYPFDQVPLIVENYQFLVKLFATGIVFFYNFYMKRFAFEKRFVE